MDPVGNRDRRASGRAHDLPLAEEGFIGYTRAGYPESMLEKSIALKVELPGVLFEQDILQPGDQRSLPINSQPSQSFPQLRQVPDLQPLTIHGDDDVLAI